MAFKKLKLWFDRELAVMLADKIVQIQIDFNESSFCQAVDDGVQDLELKPRVELIADLLHTSLGGTFLENLIVLSKILGPKNEEETGMFTNYYWIMPIAKYVEKYGLDHFEESMTAIEQITQRNTGEYAIRPFLQKYPDQGLAQMIAWSAHQNKHVRRLACEGLRPRLPWATKMTAFIQDPSPILPVLNQLKDDSSKYVQNSVANCVNDILKDNFSVGIKLLEDWVADAGSERKWIIKHAIRNGRKKQEKWALQLMDKL